MADGTIGDARPLEPFPEDWDRALAIVAHPDDLEYGVASAVARWTSQGRTVTYLLVTRGEAGIDSMAPEVAAPRREAEERHGAAAVGVEVVEFLDGHADGVIERGLPLRRDLARAIRRHRPELILTINFSARWDGGGFNQADHVAVGSTIVDASRDAANRWVFRDLAEAEGLEPWSGVRRLAIAGSPEPTHAVDVGEHLDRGIASLEAHGAYLDGLPADMRIDPGPWLRQMAGVAGERFGGRPAITLELIDL